MKPSSMCYLVGQGISSIWKNRLMAFASTCVLMVSLLLIGLSVLMGMNVNRIVKDIEKTNEIIVYLTEDTTYGQIQDLNLELAKIDNVSNVVFYSKEQAFLDLKSGMTGYEELFESLGDESPLLDSFRIKVLDTSLIYGTVDEINQLDNIETVQAPYDFANILTQIKRLVMIISGTILAALLVVSILIISNATKASVFTRRKEIGIMKYVGATDTFIKIPFFIEGMLTGVIAGSFAFAVTMISYDALLHILTKDLSIWTIIGSGGLIPFETVAVNILVIYLVLGSFIGAVGSVLSTRRYLDV